MLCMEDETKVIKEIELLGNVIDASNDHENTMPTEALDAALGSVEYE